MPQRDRGIIEMSLPKNIAKKHFKLESYPGFGGMSHKYGMTEAEVESDLQYHLLNAGIHRHP